MDLSTRIRDAISISGKTQAGIAREMGITQSAITQWLTGRVKGLRAETAHALEKATGVNAQWITTGLGPKLAAPGPLSKYDASVLLASWETAAIWLAGGQQPESEIVNDIWVPCPVKHTEYAYALDVQGASMFNPSSNLSFSPGDRIYVEPDQAPVHGSIVLAKLPESEEATFRQLLIDGGALFLQALNPSWPNRIIDVQRERAIVGGVVVARATIFS